VILAPGADARFASAVVRAARPDEDVLVEVEQVERALHRAFPRVLLITGPGPSLDELPGPRLHPGMRTVVVDAPMRDRWMREWRSHDVPPPRVAFLAEQVAPLLLPERPLWPDPLLTWMRDGAGRTLPVSLQAFLRRVLEDPSRYTDLQAVEARAGISAGALKGRFRRRDLPSPFDYLRWGRTLAAAHLLKNPKRSVATTARLLGMGTSGNLCRYVLTTTGLSPGHFRTPGGRETLHLAFRWRLLGLEALHEWDTLDLGIWPQR
jgi:AraC-like DNA-binding protein